MTCLLIVDPGLERINGNSLIEFAGTLAFLGEDIFGNEYFFFFITTIVTRIFVFSN